MEVTKQSIVIRAECPECHDEFQVLVSQEELDIAKHELTLITKAILHSQESQHVVTLHIDWEGRVRRKNTYPYTDESQMPEEGFSNLNLSEILEKMGKISKTR